jgi:hypothetical protein
MFHRKIAIERRMAAMTSSMDRVSPPWMRAIETNPSTGSTAWVFVCSVCQVEAPWGRTWKLLPRWSERPQWLAERQAFWRVVIEERRLDLVDPICGSCDDVRVGPVPVVRSTD